MTDVKSMSPRSGRSTHRRIAAAASISLLVGLAFGSSASAQIGEDLLPPLPLPTSSPTPEAPPSPSPSVEPTLPFNEPPLPGDDDTIEQLLGGEDSPPPGDDDPPTGPGTDPSPDGGGDPTNGATHDDPGAAGGSAGGPGDGDGDARQGEDAAGGSIAQTFLDTSSRRAYPSAAARATVAAAGRAIRLAGPLAPPLLLAALAVAGLLAIGRGSDRIIKVEALMPRTKTFRL